MSELTDEKHAAALAAHAKMGEALAEYLEAIGDVGEPEVIDSAVVLFEARGMNDAGQTSRTSFIIVEPAPVTTMLGMLDLSGEKVQDHLRCYGHGHE